MTNTDHICVRFSNAYKIKLNMLLDNLRELFLFQQSLYRRNIRETHIRW